MDGDIAPLPEIVEAAEEVGAAVYVDDAHASGVLGRNGRGSVDHFGLHGRVDIQVGTLSKAVGVLGGYVAGSQALRDLLIQRARPFLFSTSHPPGRRRGVPRGDPRDGGRALADRAPVGEHAAASRPSWRAWASTPADSETPITPIIVGESELANRFSSRLFEEGVFATSVDLPDRRPGPGAAPDHRHRGPDRRAPRSRARDVRARGQRARDHLRLT